MTAEQYTVTEVERKEDAVLGLILSRPRISWGEVAQAFGYPTPRAAQTAFEVAWQRRVRNDEQTKEFLREMASAQIDNLMGTLAGKAMNPDHPEHLAAVGRARELIADQRKLFGLDAPSEINVGVTPSAQELENWVNKMKGQRQLEESDIFADFDAETIEGEAVEVDEIEF